MEESTKQMALKMLEREIDYITITQVTGLTSEQLEIIQQEAEKNDK